MFRPIRLAQLVASGLGVAWWLASMPAFAEVDGGWTTSPTPPASPAQVAPAQTAPAPVGEPRRDPDGKRGISPFWEELKKGDGAFLARDYEAALAHYRQAVVRDPRDAEGHLRMAEAQVSLGQLLEARESLDAALRFAGDDGGKRARATFLLADVAERRGALDDALAAWRAYLQLAEVAQKRAVAPSKKSKEASKATPSPGSPSTGSPSTGSPSTASQPPSPAEAPRVYTKVAKQRIERIEARLKALEQYRVVRERIAARLEEADQRLQNSK